MKIGTITKPNEKGQIVIPKDIRERLGIGRDIALNMVVRGGGIYLQPVSEVMSVSEGEQSYFKVLARTKGAWFGDSEPLKKNKKQLELEASKRRKKKW